MDEILWPDHSSETSSRYYFILVRPVYTFSRLWIKFFDVTIQMNSHLGGERTKEAPKMNIDKEIH